MVLNKRIHLAVLFAALVASLATAASATEVPPEQKAWEILEAAVNEKAFLRRAQAVHVLGLLQDNTKAATLAEKALDDPAPEVRVAAATALGQMHSHASIPKLEHALDDKETSVVLAAAHSLAMLGDQGAFDVYYEILIGERKGSRGLKAQITSQERMLRDRKKLAQFGFEEGIGFVPFASMGWEVVKKVHADDVSPVRAAAAKVLAEDPDPRSARALVKACADKSWVVRAAALDALARRGDPAFLNDIQPSLADDKDLVRYTASAAIIRLSAIPVKPPKDEPSRHPKTRSVEPGRVKQRP